MYERRQTDDSLHYAQIRLKEIVCAIRTESLKGIHFRLNITRIKTRIIFSTLFDQISRHVLFYQFLRRQINTNIESKMIAGLISNCSPQRADDNGYQTCLLSQF